MRALGEKENLAFFVFVRVALPTSLQVFYLVNCPSRARLGNYTGYDGLRMRDLPELKIKGSEVSFEKMPTLVVVRSAARASRKQLLVVAGFNQEELDKMDVPSMSDEELQNMVRNRLVGGQVTNGASQKLVSLGEANDYLVNGWEYVVKLASNKVVIKIAPARAWPNGTVDRQDVGLVASTFGQNVPPRAHPQTVT